MKACVHVRLHVCMREYREKASEDGHAGALGSGSLSTDSLELLERVWLIDRQG